MLKVAKFQLSNDVKIEDIANSFNQELKKYFVNASASVVDCPDLKKSPFDLASSGLGGNTVIADVGGPPYLIPLVNRKKTYSFDQIAKIVNVGSECFMIGASAGPFHLIGQNSEFIPNVLLSKKTNSETYDVAVNKTHYSKITNENYVLSKTDYAEFGLLANFFISEGKPGKVIKIEAKQRTGQDNFITILRKILKQKYNHPISLGGVFLIKSGKAKLHIMPDFSKVPLTSDEDVNNWLRFFNMDSVLVCLTSFHSIDPDLDLRMEHTHCFSDHNQGGHYHYDTTPEDVEYIAYLNVAQMIYRIDAPEQSHNIGRD